MPLNKETTALVALALRQVGDANYFAAAKIVTKMAHPRLGCLSKLALVGLLAVLTCSLPKEVDGEMFSLLLPMLLLLMMMMIMMIPWSILSMLLDGAVSLLIALLVSHFVAPAT